MYQVNLNPQAREALYRIAKHYEGLHDGDLKTIGLQPKMCPAGYWTEGYGRVITDGNGKMIKGASNKALAYKYSKIKTEEQALADLDLGLYARQVSLERQLLKAGLKLNDFQKAALIDFVYNCGLGTLLKSSLWRDIKSGANRSQIDIDFRKYNKGGGKVLTGLDKRRTCESYLYLISQLKIF